MKSIAGVIVIKSGDVLKCISLNDQLRFRKIIKGNYYVVCEKKTEGCIEVILDDECTIDLIEFHKIVFIDDSKTHGLVILGYYSLDGKFYSTECCGHFVLMSKVRSLPSQRKVS